MGFTLFSLICRFLTGWIKTSPRWRSDQMARCGSCVSLSSEYVIPLIRVSCAAAFRSHHCVIGGAGRPPSHPGKPHEGNIFGKTGIFYPYSDHLSGITGRGIALASGAMATSTIRPPIWRRASDTTRCKVKQFWHWPLLPCRCHRHVQRRRRRAFPIAFALHQGGREISGLTKICYYNCAKWEGAMIATDIRGLPALDGALAVEQMRNLAQTKIHGNSKAELRTPRTFFGLGCCFTSPAIVEYWPRHDPRRQAQRRLSMTAAATMHRGRPGPTPMEED